MKLFSISILGVLCTLFSSELMAQSPKMEYKTNGYWQQQADYSMEIDMNVNTYQYKGKQQIEYTNNSPDVLDRVYYHLFFNAFQPDSEMDARLNSIPDPDGRMVNNLGTKENPNYESRISILKPNEIGYIKVNSLQQNGRPVKFTIDGTIMIVDLNTPIASGASVDFDMVFDGQVPLQVRRAGRNSDEGVALSMSQWYPKMAEYDDEGWHADPYIGREFYGVWGNFDVKITIDKDYMIGGTGYLQNPDEIGFGYSENSVKKQKSKNLTWHFVAPNVHDFTWAADPDFVHDTMQVPDGPLLHFLYKKSLDKPFLDSWKKLQPKTVALMQYFSEHIGEYPYEQYSVIQGGDGGMEYAMCTLITGERSFGSLVGVTAHELAHTWFQFLLATNESKHEWMDEGFTTYISSLAMNEIMDPKKDNPLASAYSGYSYLATSGYEQPLTTHADRYNVNQAYGISAYSKGAVFIAQLAYVIGDDNLRKTIKKYYNDFAFKHPKPADFIRTAEHVSKLELDWYLTDFGQTTNIIDYGVKSVDGKTITLERLGNMPMPIDLEVSYTDGSTQSYYIPLRMMRGGKPTLATTIDNWAWAYPTYSFAAASTVKSVQINPTGMMADVNDTNNVFPNTAEGQ
ncbi:M1 family metallopeptidase [Subsaximicrobium wynnwilliamsii]|uniref:M1 family metallopeptidase n=1 Tax=Subsaximicrobium wynnwilliamsii TaxID=291179 RepID=A0A5C6ZHN4_9FLAO|nr:M1 family metallopeptidase [Subsaximicrobium wynnwilliamsii]TXD88424.1 M1 family metallopeptidase [Subsaximicrobium wynnwilliamsii]TXE02351.1 M1 family metallopeptidase [Subsaximicrobium wynnwilliamsii]